MGERHMVYVRLDDKNFGHYLKEDIYFNGNVIGLHHQWLLGYDALNCLVNVLDVHQKNSLVHEDKYFNHSPFQIWSMDSNYRTDQDKIHTYSETVLQAIYNACPITGFWSSSARIVDKEHFFWIDNNTGMTIVDLAEFNEPKYCFLNPGSLFVDANVQALESGVPMDAKTYLTAFGEPPERWPDGHLQTLLEKISKIQLLTIEELYDIFLPMRRLDSSSAEIEQNPLFLPQLGEDR